MADKIFVGDTPVLLIDAQNPDDAAIDITGLTVSLEVWKPGALVAESWTATVASATELTRQTVTGDFDTAGEYRIQALVVDGVKRWLGDTVRKTVYAPGA